MSRSRTGPDAARSRPSSPPDGSNAEADAETIAAWTSGDAEAIAAENRAKRFRRERLRSDVRALASQALATLREMVSGPDVPPAVRLRACLAILQAADAITAEEIGPTSAEGVRAKIEHDEFIESLGG
jgi:hypothetical protein